MSSAVLGVRLLGAGVRGWYWLMRGRLDKSMLAVQDLLALRPPARSLFLIQARAVLLNDLADAGLERLWRRAGSGPDAERAWHEVVDDLVERGWDRERVETLLLRLRRLA